MKDIIEEFDKEFPDSRNIFDGGDRYGRRRKSIHQFIQKALDDQLNQVEEIVEEHKYSMEFHSGKKVELLAVDILLRELTNLNNK